MLSRTAVLTVAQRRLVAGTVHCPVIQYLESSPDLLLENLVKQPEEVAVICVVFQFCGSYGTS